MSILKSFQYTQIDKNKYKESLVKLNENKHLEVEDLHAIVQNLHNIEDEEIVLKLLNSDISEDNLKQLLKLLPNEDLVKALDNSTVSKMTLLFSYPKNILIGTVLFIVSLILKPTGILLILSYLIACLQTDRILRNLTYKKFTKK